VLWLIALLVILDWVVAQKLVGIMALTDLLHYRADHDSLGIIVACHSFDAALSQQHPQSGRSNH